MKDTPPPLDVPPLHSIDTAVDQSRFLIERDTAKAWFEYRGPTLFITFDNLATVQDGFPRKPWMDERLTKLNYSVLGMQSHAKDWFRTSCAPTILRQLKDRGFFDRFDRIVLMGASMGGFAALNFAPLIPGSWVLAFSAQSTMSQKIAPFEKRFSFAVKRSNWENPPFLDAAAAVPYIERVALVFDPYDDEDSAHAARMTGDHVQQIKCAHFTHQAIRMVIKCDALPEMMKEFAETGRIGPAIWSRLRNRRDLRLWRRMLVEKMLNPLKHPKLLLRVCEIFLRDKDYKFAIEARQTVLDQFPNLNTQPQ